MSTSYTVSVEQYAERHFIKKFKKKYKGAWDISFTAVLRQLQNLDVLFHRSIAEKICESSGIMICKTEFRIAGTNDSRHSSGNRIIIAVHKQTRLIRVLLVYHKDHLGKGNETAEWKKCVKENYPDLSHLL